MGFPGLAMVFIILYFIVAFVVNINKERTDVSVNRSYGTTAYNLPANLNTSKADLSKPSGGPGKKSFCDRDREFAANYWKELKRVPLKHPEGKPKHESINKKNRHGKNSADQVPVKIDLTGVETRMKKFKLYWIDDKWEVVEGVSIENALARAGYGNDALEELDQYEEIKDKYLI